MPKDTRKDQVHELVQKIGRAITAEDRGLIGQALQIREAEVERRSLQAGIREAADELMKAAEASFRNEADKEADRLRSLAKMLLAHAKCKGARSGEEAEDSDFAFGLLYGIAEDGIELPDPPAVDGEES